MVEKPRFLIQEGLVKVNSEVETRRGRKLVKGDRVEFDSEEFIVDMVE